MRCPLIASLSLRAALHIDDFCIDGMMIKKVQPAFLMVLERIAGSFYFDPLIVIGSAHKKVRLTAAIMPSIKQYSFETRFELVGGERA